MKLYKVNYENPGVGPARLTATGFSSRPAAEQYAAAIAAGDAQIESYKDDDEDDDDDDDED